MSRNIDKDFLQELKEYIKLEWMKNGQQPFCKTLKEMSIDIFGEEKSSLKNKIHLYLPRLENAGYIKITPGAEKGNPNWFTWIDDNFIQQLSEEKEQITDTIEDFLIKSNILTQMANNIYGDILQRLTSALGELHYCKQLISNLELFSTTPDGNQILTVKKGIDAVSIIESIKSGQKRNNNTNEFKWKENNQENNPEYNQE